MVDLESVIGNLIELSERKYLLLLDVLSLTEKQTKAVTDEDMDELSLQIDQKQVKIDNMKKLDIEFESIVDDLKTVYGVKSLDELNDTSSNIGELKLIIEKIMNKVREIYDIEEFNRNTLSNAKDELQKKIQHTGKGRNAVKQYTSFGSYENAYFLDKKLK